MKRQIPELVELSKELTGGGRGIYDGSVAVNRSLCRLCCMSFTAFSSMSPSSILSKNDMVWVQRGSQVGCREEVRWGEEITGERDLG